MPVTHNESECVCVFQFYKQTNQPNTHERGKVNEFYLCALTPRVVFSSSSSSSPFVLVQVSPLEQLPGSHPHFWGLLAVRADEPSCLPACLGSSAFCTRSARLRPENPRESMLSVCDGSLQQQSSSNIHPGHALHPSLISAGPVCMNTPTRWLMGQYARSRALDRRTSERTHTLGCTPSLSLTHF